MHSYSMQIKETKVVPNPPPPLRTGALVWRGGGVHELAGTATCGRTHGIAAPSDKP